MLSAGMHLRGIKARSCYRCQAAAAASAAALAAHHRPLSPLLLPPLQPCMPLCGGPVLGPCFEQALPSSLLLLALGAAQRQAEGRERWQHRQAPSLLQTAWRAAGLCLPVLPVLVLVPLMPPPLLLRVMLLVRWVQPGARARVTAGWLVWRRRQQVQACTQTSSRRLPPPLPLWALQIEP